MISSESLTKLGSENTQKTLLNSTIHLVRTQKAAVSVRVHFKYY